MNLGLSIILTLMILISAPFTASFYKEPSLTSLIAIMALSFFLKNISAIHECYIRKEMRFKQLQIIRFFSVLIYGVISISLALNGKGVWSIVIGFLAMNTFVLFSNLIIAKMPLHNKLYLNQWRRLFDFSKFVIISVILWHLLNNLDQFIVGKAFGTEAIGEYALAINYSLIVPVVIGMPFYEVLLSDFSKNQKDLNLIKEKFLSTMQLLFTLLMPGALLAFFIGDDIFLLILGTKWQAGAKIFSIYAGCTILTTCLIGANASYEALGKPQYNLFVGLYFAPILFILVFFGSKLDIVFMGGLMALSKICHATCHYFVINKCFEVNIKNFFTSLKTGLINGFITALIGFILLFTLKDYSQLIRIPIFLIAIPSVYCLSVFTLSKNDFEYLKENLISMIKRKAS